jgi:anhydro-N-acetylmuramic acid kinase
MTWFRSIGMMSGTSMDGVDVAFIETDGKSDVRQGPKGFFPYSDSDRATLREALNEATSLTDRDARPGALAKAQAIVTGRHSAAIADFLSDNGLTRAGVDIVGFHGQTVLHRPERRLTVQIGDGDSLARTLGMPVAWDMRAADVAAGGQGAPLVPVYHRALAEAAQLDLPAAVLNIGGVANITFLPEHGDPIAFDTGPGNALLDDLMLERTGTAMDRDGATAARGTVNEPVLQRLLDHPYFVKPAPKSLDRNDFSRGPVADLSTADAAATLTAFTAASVARSLDLVPQRPTKIIVCGGGASNPTLMKMLAQRCGVDLMSADAMGWSADAMEAQAFAYLAVRALNGLPLTFPGTTGVAQPMTGGIISRPA